MSQYSGRDGVFKVGASNLAELRSFEISETAILDEGAQMGDTWNRQNVIAKQFAGSATYRLDPGTSAQDNIVAGDEVNIEAYPIGESSGRLKLTGTVVIEEVSYPADLNSSGEGTCTFQGQGALTRTVIA